MTRLHPIASTTAGLRDVLTAALRSVDGNELSAFADALEKYAGGRAVMLTGSGMEALYVILKSLQERTAARVVLLPAYTAPSVAVCVRLAGCTPVLCDVDPSTFAPLWPASPPANLMCVINVHLFGLYSPPPSFGVPVVEDCAQALGTSHGGVRLGALGDYAFYSFNKGKNLPLYGGGAILLDDAGRCSVMRRLLLDEAASSYSAVREIEAFCRLFVLSLAVRPSVYGTFQRIISRYKDTAPPTAITRRAFTRVQAALGLRLLARIDKDVLARHERGMLYMDALADVPFLRLPRLEKDVVYAFNRFPVLVDEEGRLLRIMDALSACGVESSRMYLRPLHRIEGLGCGGGKFPGAEHIASGLLTLPVHPRLPERTITLVSRRIREV